MNITHEIFGHTPDGKPVDAFTLSNPNGVQARVMSYGVTIVSLRAPDRAGRLDDITLGFDNLDGYLGRHPFFGCIAGRYANRIGGAAFALNGKPYTLAANNGANHLHGGAVGFNRKVWTPERRNDGVAFTYVSPDGEEGYPGTLSTRVTYALSDANEFSIHYHATTDADTVINLTNHSYFNLDGSADILDHELMLACDAYTPTDAGMIPTGALAPVAGTPMDFRAAQRIGARIEAPFEALQFGEGYDHNYVINGAPGTLRLAARAHSAKSGRVLECLTDQPGVQFYAGNFIDRAGPIAGKGGRIYGRRSGLCLETQHFPDSPNQPAFPSAVLRAGATYDTRTVYRVGVA